MSHQPSAPSTQEDPISRCIATVKNCLGSNDDPKFHENSHGGKMNTIPDQARIEAQRIIDTLTGYSHQIMEMIKPEPNSAITYPEHEDVAVTPAPAPPVPPAPPVRPEEVVIEAIPTAVENRVEFTKEDSEYASKNILLSKKLPQRFVDECKANFGNTIMTLVDKVCAHCPLAFHNCR